MRGLTFSLAAVLASPAYAAGGGFSLQNSDFVVTIAFLLFLGVLIYFKVPSMIGKLLDDRSEAIRNELEEARSLREEAQKVLADFERKQKEVEDQATQIVAQAKADAEQAAEAAKDELARTIARRLQSAEDQIASAEAGAVKQVRDTAVEVAIAAARDVIAGGINSGDAGSLIEDSIKIVDAKLH